VLVQLHDHVSGRIKVVQNRVVLDKSLEVDSGYLCAEGIEQTSLNVTYNTAAIVLLLHRGSAPDEDS
jgi:hypothetical protein